MKKILVVLILMSMIFSGMVLSSTFASGEGSRAGSPPSITTTNILTASVGLYYSVNYTATDPDTNQSSLVWGWTTNSTWLTFTSSQELKGTPIRTGVCWVNISVTDGSNYDYAVFYIEVNQTTSPPANQPPVITTSNLQSVYAGYFYSMNYTATDPDTNQSSLIWVMNTNASWLNFSSTQELKGTPTQTGIYWVNISVTDGTSTSYTAFYITVTKYVAPPRYKSPVITTTDVLTAYVGKFYSVNYTAYDQDTEQVNLTWNWKTNSTWLNFTAYQELRGTPTKTGVCWVNISVTDGVNTASAVFYITITRSTTPPPPSSKAPVITTTPVTTAYTNTAYSVNFTATDADTPQKNLTWSFKSNATWLTFTANQELKGTPTKAGNYWVNISVTDGSSFDYAPFYIAVYQRNTPPPPSSKGPSIITKNVLYATVGLKYSVQYKATDPDTSSANLTWSFKTNATWLTFSSSQLLSGTPTKAGVCWVNITVTDGTRTDSAVFYITIAVKRNTSYAPAVLSETLSQEDPLVPTDTEKFAIAFTEEMDTASVNSALTISPEVDHTITWNSDNTVMTITFNEELSAETEYRVTIDVSALDAKGNALGSEYTLEFTTGSEPDGSGPIDNDEQPVEDVKTEGAANLLPIAGSVIVILLILILMAYMVMVKKRRIVDPDMHEGRISFDEQNGVVEDVDMDSPPTTLTTGLTKADEIFEEAKLDAFGPDRPSTTGPDKEGMVDELSSKLSNGEISQNTFDEAMNMLSGKKP